MPQVKSSATSGNNAPRETSLPSQVGRPLLPRDGHSPQERIDQIQEMLETPRPIVAAARDYAQGDRTPWHAHPRAQLVYATSGVIAVTAKSGHGAEGVWVVPPERAVWMPGGMEHQVEFRSNVELRSLFVRPDAASDFPDICCVVTVSPLLRELIRTAVTLPLEYELDGAAARLMSVILDQLEILDQAPLHLPLPDDARLKRIVDTLAGNPADTRTLDEWAKTAGASTRTLARLFVRETGLNFGAWRQQARLLKALELLAAGQSVTNTALDLGYDSPSAFIAMFRKALGVSPGKYFT